MRTVLALIIGMIGFIVFFILGSQMMPEVTKSVTGWSAATIGGCGNDDGKAAGNLVPLGADMRVEGWYSAGTGTFPATCTQNPDSSVTVAYLTNTAAAIEYYPTLYTTGPIASALIFIIQMVTTVGIPLLIAGLLFFASLKLLGEMGLNVGGIRIGRSKGSKVF